MYCSHCGAQNPEDAEKCIACGRDIGHKRRRRAEERAPEVSGAAKPEEQKPSEMSAAAEGASEEAAHAQEPAEHVFCPYCGAKNNKGDNNCRACGRPLRALTGQGTSYTPGSAGAGYDAMQSGRQQAGGAYAPAYQQYGQPAPPQAAAEINDFFVPNLIMTIVSFVCCCQPISFILGIVGMVNGNSAKSKIAYGDINGAQDSANTSRILFFIGLAFLAVSIIGAILYVFFVIGIASASGEFEQLFQNMEEMNRQMNQY